MTLTDLCKEINNWFVKEKKIGKFNIVSGTIIVDSLQDGQYFRIVGSVFNDGVHQYPAANLHDEEFEGGIWEMAVPSEVIDLVSKINEWVDKYSDVLDSPFSSESFGGYSYSKANVSGSSGSSQNASWQSQFKRELNQWRKI